MKCAIELYFDGGTERRFLALLRELATAGVPSLLLDCGMRPHLSLFVCDGVAPGLDNALREFAKGVEPLPARFDHVGSFHGDEGTLFAAPVVTPALLDLHRRGHALLAPHCSGLDAHSMPGRWVPHCTQSMFLTAPQVALGLEICRRRLPIEGTLALVGLHRVPFDPRSRPAALPPAADCYPFTHSLGA
ncbi:MAG: 2'-5' RNA ligase family protein [Planctomycetaceae bacterium]